jgi:hypothetical protein
MIFPFMRNGTHHKIIDYMLSNITRHTADVLEKLEVLCGLRGVPSAESFSTQSRQL